MLITVLQGERVVYDFQVPEEDSGQWFAVKICAAAADSGKGVVGVELDGTLLGRKESSGSEWAEAAFSAGRLPAGAHSIKLVGQGNIKVLWVSIT